MVKLSTTLFAMLLSVAIGLPISQVSILSYPKGEAFTYH